MCVGGYACGVTEVYLTSLWQGSLAAHLSNHSVEYIQFSFRWMNNLLMREFPLRCIIRLWDSYLVSAPLPPPATHTCTYFTGHVCDLLFQSERNGFATFHVYVCAALLKWFSEDIQAHKDFQVLTNYLPAELCS